MIEYKTLVLNADYTPISVLPLHVISAKQAVIRLFAETCSVVSDYGVPIKTPNPNIRLNWPSVIIRKEYVKRTQRPVLTKTSLLYRDRGHCAYCNTKLSVETITRDHVMPLSKGGKDDWLNVVAACPTCNYLKSDHLPVGRWKPSVKPWHPTHEQLIELRKLFPVTIYHSSWVDYLPAWKGEVKVAWS